MSIIKKTLKLFQVHRLYQFFHNRVYMAARAVWEEVGLITLLLRNTKYSSDDEVILASLRTKTHILDKGLQSDYWMPNRGKTVYNECVKRLNLLSDSPLKSDPSYQWAKGKILEYEKAQRLKRGESSDYIPIHDNVKTRGLLCEIIKTRRSVRFFLDRPIQADVLEKLVDVVNWGPASCNRQPIVLHVTQKRGLIRRCVEQCAGWTCFSEIGPACFIAVCTDMRFYELADRHLHLIDGTFGIQNLLLLAHTYGIEGTVLNWMCATKRQNRTLRKLLDIPKYQKIIFNLVLGYPAKAAHPPGRKEVDRTYKLH